MKKTRKIGFHNLTLSNKEIDVIDVYNKVLDCINKLPRLKKKIELGKEKIYFIDKINLKANTYNLIFKSATHNRRLSDLPLIQCTLRKEINCNYST